MRVYISGKITGLNYSKVEGYFSGAEAFLLSMGHEPINPLNNGLLRTSTWERHMVKDIELLMTCEAIFLLGNWVFSKGARIEKYIADEMGLKVMYQTGDFTTDSRILDVKRAIRVVTGLDFKDYVGESREKVLLFPRLIFCKHVKDMVEMPDKELAKLVNRSRSMVIQYIKNYPSEYKYNKEFRHIATNVENVLIESVSQ